MKKVLLASTMLIASGSMAAADLTFNGFGRFGILYQGNPGAQVDETRLEQRFRLNIVGTAETDGGVKFGARMRIQTDDDAFGEGNASKAFAPEFNVQAGGFRLDVGNTSDVIDSGDVVDYYGYGVGLTSFLEQSSGFGLPVSGISSADSVDPTVKARYAIGDFTVAGSYTNDSDGLDAEEWQVGAGYKFGDFAVGAAYGNLSADLSNLGVGLDDIDSDFWAVSFGGTIGSVGFSLLYADSDEQDDSSFGGSVVIPIGAATDIRLAVAESGIGDADTAYGVGFRHNLGGGVSMRGGFGENAAGYGVGDLGVIFDF